MFEITTERKSGSDNWRWTVRETDTLIVVACGDEPTQLEAELTAKEVMQNILEDMANELDSL